MPSANQTMVMPIFAEGQAISSQTIAGEVNKPRSDPRRLPATALSRTRRCPPPVEDDTGENIFLLAWVLMFTLAVW